MRDKGWIVAFVLHLIIDVVLIGAGVYLFATSNPSFETNLTFSRELGLYIIQGIGVLGGAALLSCCVALVCMPRSPLHSTSHTSHRHHPAIATALAPSHA